MWRLFGPQLSRLDRVSTFQTLLAALVVAFCAVPTPAAADAEPSRWVAAGLEDPTRPAPGDRVVIIGSSSIRGNFGRTLERRFAGLGFETFRQGVSSSGISRPDYFDWYERATTLPIDDHTAAVLIYVGVNDPQGIWMPPAEQKARGRRDRWIRWHEAMWDVVYRERMTALIDRLCDRGARRVVVLTPVDVRWRGLQERLVRVRRLQIEAARTSRCGRVVSTSGDDLALRDPERGDVTLRMPDGYHLSTPGAEIVWDRIMPHLLRVVGGLPRATPEAERIAGDGETSAQAHDQDGG
ncbi:MAG: DUF459 domain-containing protein [Deltaproteobacteria bacterium]|nr:DUF459 domain-containing protein [Deltaproteobacteria bacterium]